jgi:guanylate kinase
MQDFPGVFGFSVSHTTRAPRDGEKDGIQYNFTTRQEMESAIERGAFIENAEVHGNLYGTSYEAVSKIAEKRQCCILDVDVQGAQQIRNTSIKPVAIFITPPSVEVLEKRLRERGTESEEKIKLRVANARGEMQFMNNRALFDYVVVNDTLDKCYAQFKEIVEETIIPLI